MSDLSPIALFTYKRLDTLKKTVAALKNNTLALKSDLIIFSDGAKTEYDKPVVESVRNYLRTINGFKSVTINESPVNKGLATSIITGVSEVIAKYKKVIVLEDDLVTSANFLEFMNESLSNYNNEKKVFSISGFSFDLNLKLNEDVYFLNRGWSWGWATWIDRWELLDWEVKDFNQFAKNKNRRKQFSEGGSDLNSMLNKQMNGHLDSWAIRWFYNQFKVNGITLYPVKSKINNVGFGEDATHTKGSSRRYQPDFDITKQTKFSFTKEISINKIAQKKFQYKMGYISRMISKIQTILKIN